MVMTETTLNTNKAQKIEFNWPREEINSEVFCSTLYMSPGTALTYIAYNMEFFWETVTKHKNSTWGRVVWHLISHTKNRLTQYYSDKNGWFHIYMQHKYPLKISSQAEIIASI